MKGMDIYEQVKSIVDQGMERNMEKRRKMDNVMTVMRFAKEKLEEAILQVPDSYNTLVYLAKTEHWLALEGHAHLAAMARSNQTVGRTTGEMVRTRFLRRAKLRPLLMRECRVVPCVVVYVDHCGFGSGHSQQCRATA
jgi:hypothetical protein